ncbi:hypothetical protein VP01_2564g1 [Puccinia sorghi]|uniref:Uncharacterized protein n=1 Tax=Puccinia sorghi TaxID=27349 RepID=A0A0L6V6W6_9BASI|nr:hypothetical protein VP01_2564g1 [Puccinia sorghi]
MYLAEIIRWLCPQHQKAINKGANLLATSLQERKNNTKTKDGSLLVTSTKQKILITKLSIISYLCGFYVKHGPLFKRKWAATFGCFIYSDFQEAILHCLKATNSNFTSIRDVWTHFGFIGASVSFIDDYWNYFVQHLSLNQCLIYWQIMAFKEKYHDIYLLFQTNDSGSNNNTMAKPMHQKLSDLEGSELPWDYDTIHIKFFCHKMALIGNAGYDKLEEEEDFVDEEGGGHG